MGISFEKALEVAKSEYPHPIDHYEEYKDYYVFERDTGVEHTGGMTAPIVIRKSDGAALNYAPIFFNMDAEAEDVGSIVSEGRVRS